MVDALITTAGLGYLTAVAAVFCAALVAKAGAARSPSEEPERRSSVMLMLDILSALTPTLLVLYAYAVTIGQADGTQRIILMALPIFSGFAGALLGGLLSLAARDARAMFRMASIVTGTGAFIVALGVAWSRVDTSWLIGPAAALTP